jgi:hypothetical protein
MNSEYKLSEIRQSAITKMFLTIGLIVGTFLIPACSQKPNPALYGKWQEEGARDITEFREDGTFSIGGAGRETMTGKYKFTGADTIRMELAGPLATVVGPMNCRVIVQGDTLDMTMPDGTKSHNKRIK